LCCLKWLSMFVVKNGLSRETVKPFVLLCLCVHMLSYCYVNLLSQRWADGLKIHIMVPYYYV
jgi:hypothetical protein